MANHQSLPHHGKPSPALSLMLKQFTEKNLRRLRCCDGVVPLYNPCTSLIYPLYIPCTSFLLPPGLWQPSGVSTGPRPGFDRIRLAAIQSKSHFPAASILSSFASPQPRPTSPAGLSRQAVRYHSGTKTVPRI